eukprot:329993_1
MEDVKTWKTGDIILQHAADSTHSQIMTNTPWTHVGIVYRRDDICQQTALFNKDADVMIVEAVYDCFNEDLEPFNELNKFCLQDVRRRFDLNLWNETTAQYTEGYYFAHRKLKKALTEEQKRILEETIIKLKTKEFG